MGIRAYGFASKQKDSISESLTEREQMNCDLLFEMVEEADMACNAYEYQDGQNIYGVCNCYKSKFIQTRISPLDKLYCSYAYKIDCRKNKLTVLAKKKGKYSFFTTDKEVYYLENKTVIKEILESKEKISVLYLQKESDLSCELWRGQLYFSEDGSDWAKEGHIILW